MHVLIFAPINSATLYFTT